MGNPLKPNENATNYTDLRASANELLNYISFASEKDLADIRTTLAQNIAGSITDQETLNINEMLLASTDAIPLYETLKTMIVGKDSELIHGSIQPFYLNNDLIRKKTVSLIYHKATQASSYTSILSDISALFCSMIPTVEMSLCVPYFDVRIVYPKDDFDLPALNILKFVGFNPKSRELDSADPKNAVPFAADMGAKYGFDVVGMEIFGLPQTLAPINDNFKTNDDYQNRSVDILNPISPLLTIESANIQQIGVAGGLNTYSKINLELTLHDRSRLSDIEPLVSATIFPYVTFRISYGWLHPDTNKMTNNVYAKILNNMRVVQDYVVSSVSMAARGSTSLKLSISLTGSGSHTCKSAKIISGAGEYIPYGAIDSLVRQFITLKSKRSKDKQTNVDSNFTTVGSTVISSVSSAASTKKFVPVIDFYNLYTALNTQIRSEGDFLKVVEILNSLTVIEQPPTVKFTELFKFLQRDSSKYSSIEQSILSQNSFVPDSLNQHVIDTSISAGYITPPPKPETTPGPVIIAAPVAAPAVSEAVTENGNPDLTEASVVPLAEMVSTLVAKPLLISQPDIAEVRIHCFAFNSSCGKMAEENIGNFPIVKSKFLDYNVEDDTKRKINLNTSAEKALNMIAAYVNDPASPFFGFSSSYKAAAEGAKVLKELLPGQDNEEAQKQIDSLYKNTQEAIDELNKIYLKEKNITLTDTSFVPPRIKTSLEVLPAYINPLDKSKPSHKIARIIIYDERCGSFNKLANLIFAMINSNGMATLDPDLGGLDVSGTSLADKVNTFKTSITNRAPTLPSVKTTAPATTAGTTQPIATPPVDSKNSIYTLNDKRTIREIASNLYPTLVIGSEGSLISNASYATSNSGDLQTINLLTAFESQGGSTAGASSDSELVDDVFINPSTINLTMMGNTCIARGQTYYIDFNTGTTLDNSYTVMSVSHNIRPGSFTTNAVLRPTSAASLKSVQKQVQQLVVKIKNVYGLKPQV